MASLEIAIKSIPRGDDGRRVPSWEVACSCGFKSHIANVDRGLSPGNAVKEFERRGWVVGRSAERTRCPRCAEAQRSKRGGVMEKKQAASAIEPLARAAGLVARPVVDPPPEMTREHRRLIFAKLHDVYIDEQRGYAEGWGDKKIAVDLGVPEAWVANIRAENFGDVKDNEEVRKFLDIYRDEFLPAFNAIAERQRVLADEQKKLAEAIKAFDARYTPLVREGEAIRKAVAR